MQPYLFPYIGYFQLIAAVDKFVFYDDVNFIKNGWINRNRLFLAGEIRYITVPLSSASSFLKIKEVEIQNNSLWKKKMLESLRHSYAKSLNFSAINSLVSEILFSDIDGIGEMAKFSIVSIAKYLEIDTKFVSSSSCYGNDNLSGSDRVIDICKLENADCYFNLPGGRTIYDDLLFKSNGIQLEFIEPNFSPYKQFSQDFCAGLSMIDVLMFNDKKNVRAMLGLDIGKT